ncbi:MAG: pilus assembly protein [Rhodospirillales bacterium]|nr:pilus assembly protein [Rhodospirillales bacterium]
MALPGEAKAFYTRGMMAGGRAVGAIGRAMMRWPAACSERGAAAVEFALIIPVVLAGLTGIANYGLAMYNKMELVGAARAGAQQAILDRTDTTAIKNAVVNSTNLGITTADVTTTESYLCADGTVVTLATDTCVNSDPLQYYMTVTANQNFTLLLLGTSISLSGSVKVRTQ